MIPLALALAAAAPAPQTPPPPNAGGDILAAMARAGMSPAGLSALRGTAPVVRAQTQELQTRGTAIEAEIRAAALAGDVDRLARALGARDALLARFASTRTANNVALLRSLSPADRTLLMRTIAGVGSK